MKKKLAKLKKGDKIIKSSFIKEIENSLSKRAETLVYDEIKKSIMQNPALMNQFSQNEKKNEESNLIDTD